MVDYSNNLIYFVYCFIILAFIKIYYHNSVCFIVLIL